MTELPFHLQTLPPEALDVLRFFGTHEEENADVDTICEGTGLSERGFSKAIKRLVTRGYAILENDTARIYRLTQQGSDSVIELAEYDATAPAEQKKDGGGHQTYTRRMLLAAPRALAANKPSNVLVGFDSALPLENLSQPAEMVVRLEVVNGEPKTPQDEVFSLDDETAHIAFGVTPGRFNKIRLRLHVFQLGPNPDDINPAGGMYVDLDVAASGSSELVAYETSIPVMAFD
jgi:predicted transcriptional regulator